jgi:homoserine kinase
VTQPLILIGPGKVGRAVAKMLLAKGIELRAILGRKGMCYVPSTILRWIQDGESPDWYYPYSLKQLVLDFPDCLLVDCSSANWDETDWHLLLDAGAQAVFCNKSLLGAESTKLFSHPRFKESVRYEATVAAGLPLLNLITRQIDSGDQITHIKASLSGTMAWLFSELSKGHKFSEALPRAMELGYTEPDPRDDLSLEDFIRKIRILARHSGFEPKKIEAPKLLPDKAFRKSLPEFLKALKDYDAPFETLFTKQKGKLSLLQAQITPDQTELLVVAVDKNSDFGRTEGCNNIIVLHTDQYAKEPLKIAGPGAGILRTAAAVTGDCLELLSKTSVARPIPWSGSTLSTTQSVTAYAPASIGNLSCGFDVLGMAISGLGDTVQAFFVGLDGVQLLEIIGDQGMLPGAADKNTVGIVAGYLLKRSGNVNRGIGIRLHKGLPLNSGLGSSGASAAAAALAVGTLLGDLSREDYLNACLEAEALVSGRHADNVAASLLGGVVAVTSIDPLNVVSVPISSRIKIGLIQVFMEVPTKEARARIPAKFDREATIHNLGSEAALLASFISEDETVLQRGLRDHLVEPFRASMVPILGVLKPYFERRGLTLCISGAGPTLFCMSYNELKLKEALEEAGRLCQSEGIDVCTRICSVDTRGTRVVSAKA